VFRGGEFHDGEFRGGVFRGGVFRKSTLFIQGTRYSISYCGKLVLKIGCEIHTIQEWLKNYEDIGSKNNFSKLEIEEYKLYIDLAAKLYLKK
jgi:hypothetical protein